MRAALLTECGAAPAIGDRARPVPADDEILVRVTAASITPLDRLCASGTSYFGTPATPYVPGVQGVGLREDGTAVWFPTGAGMRPGDGSMAEYSAVRAADTVELPTGADHALVAALGLSAVAAQMALTWRGELRPGERVLVLGAGGVVGQSAVRLALLAGADRVVAAARSGPAQRRAALRGRDCGRTPGGECRGRLAGRTDAGRGGRPGGSCSRSPLRGSGGGRAADTAARRLGWSTSATPPSATAPMDSATLRGGSLRVLGYTNNELTPAQRSKALTLVAAHAAAGRLKVDFETVRMEDVAAAWHRTDCRMVLIP
nr:zinc-binding dehydrogenase [Actinoplanes digitatis]